jgi:HEAT repeat protein
MSDTPETIRPRDWSREDKLFLLKGLRQLEPPERNNLLLDLVTDEDPVVRGKCAQLLEDSTADHKLRAADQLLQLDTAETTILALEILGSLEDSDVSERLIPLVDHDDKRVRTTLIDTIPSLPLNAALELLSRLLDAYDPELDRALVRTTSRINHPEMLPLLERWYDMTPDGGEAVLRTAAALDDPRAHEWVRGALSETDTTSKRTSVIEWLLGHSSGESPVN